MHFMAQRMSSPIAFQTSGGTALASAGASLLAAVQQFRKTSDLSSTWTGTSAQAHEQRVAKLIDAATRVTQAIARAQTISNTGAARMQALKTQNDATVASATAARFVVLPSGQVVPGPEHYASASGPHYAAIMKMYWTIAKLYTGQVNANVATSSATDAQVAATLATIAIEFFADLLQKKNDSGAVAPGTIPSPTDIPGGGPAPLPSFTMPPESPVIPGADVGGTSLAGAGSLGGGAFTGAGGSPGMYGGAGIGLAGTGGVGAGLPGGSIAGAGGPGMVGGIPMGGAGAAGGMAGRGGAGAVGGMGGVAGRGGAGPGAAGGTAGGRGGGGAGAAAAGRAGGGGGMAPMVGMGQGGAHHDRQADSQTWLQEDSNPWDPDDAPDSVLT
jgi:uncharacterized protein YukE